MDDELTMPTRHKKKLERIRNERKGEFVSRDNSTSAIGLVQAATGQDEGSLGEFEGIDHYSEYRDSRVEVIAPAPGGHDSGLRYAVNADEYTDTGTYRSDNETRTGALSAEEELERKKELNRQRVARFREKQRAEKQKPEFSSLENDTNVTSGNAKGNGFSFLPRKNVAEPVKLITKTEAEEYKQNLIYVYQQGSKLLDNIVEIVTVGHEEVQIWALDEDEAAFFAEAHLAKAQKDKAAAQAARALLKLYDKLVVLQYVCSRGHKTYVHIKVSGGLSFK